MPPAFVSAVFHLETNACLPRSRPHACSEGTEASVPGSCISETGDRRLRPHCMVALRFVDHPSRETFQEILEAFQMLPRELVFHIGPFQGFLETAEPNLARLLVNLKRKMPGSHAGRTVLLKVEGRSSEDSHEEQRGLLRGFLQVGWEKMPDLGLLQLFIEIRHHPEDVAFAHDPVDFGVGTWTLRRSAGRRVNNPFHSATILTRHRLSFSYFEGFHARPRNPLVK